MIKIAGYVSPLVAYDRPTGVGQHILGMFSAVQSRPDVKFGLISPRDRQQTARELTRRHNSSQVFPTPWPDRVLRYGTTLVSAVNIDRWLNDSQWVYVPVEQPVTTRRALAVTVHDLCAFEPCIEGTWHRAAGPSWRLRMSRIIARADLIVTVSEFTRSRLLELFASTPPERVAVVGNGGAEGFTPDPQAEDSDILRRYALEPGAFVLFPASLTMRKGADLLLAAARLAQERQATFQFVVIGRRHERDLVAALRRNQASNSRFPVTLLGYVPQSDLAALYRHAVATFLPSRYEGFGIPVVEALQSGCPLIISRQSALIEVAAGRATIVDNDPACVLDAIAAARRRLPKQSDCRHTWAGCAEKLIAAMRARAC